MRSIRLRHTLWTLPALAAGIVACGGDEGPAAPTKVVFTVQPTDAIAGVAIASAVQVAIQDASGNTVTSATAPVTMALGANPGGGTLAGTLTVAATQGIATFSTLRIDQPGSGYTLAASAVGFSGATSAPFAVTAIFAVAPVLSNANGAVSPTGPVGSTVVLSGAGFGDVQGSGQVLFTPSGGGVARQATIANPGDWTQAAIVTTVPVGASGSSLVRVQAGGLASGTVQFTVTPDVTFNTAAVTWTAGPSLPTAVSGTSVAFAQVQGAGFVYAVGGAGAGGAPVATVSYATVATNGTLGAWMAATALPTALEFPAAVAATQGNSAVISNGFLYAVGGATSAAAAPVSTVYRAPINTDGSLGTWVTVTALPAPLRSVAAIVQYGSLYVIGGATHSNTPVATAYRSPIQVDGAVSWRTQPSLPSARARFGYGANGLYLYAFGGDSTALAPNDTAGAAKRVAQIVYAKLSPSTRDIISWTAAATALTDARSANPAMLGAGNVLLTGGLYNGASAHTSEAVYAQLNADGTTGIFTTASPATSINSLCGCNLFNHGGTGYVAGNGTFHVVIVGGDNVSAPGMPRLETFID